MLAHPEQTTTKSSLAVQRMEAQLSHAVLLHRKCVAEREKHLAALARGVRKQHASKSQAQAQIASLTSDLHAQAPIANKAVKPRGGDVDARMKDLREAHQLRAIANAQQREIADLREALVRLHMATFASFVDTSTNAQNRQHDER